MKRQQLEKQIRTIVRAHGAEMSMREGGNHTVITINGQPIPVPRHREIDERLAARILKDATTAAEV